MLSRVNHLEVALRVGVCCAVLVLRCVNGCYGDDTQPATPSRHPNVLLILTDDQGWGDVRSHGNPAIETPRMDRLAAEGVRFDRFFVSPVCAPTRASLLTGRYHLRTGVHGVTRGRETMREDEVTLAEMFRAAGYATGCFGKWHNGAHMPQHPNGQGFDQFVGFCAGHWNNYFDTTLQHNGHPLETKGYINDVLTDAAIEFIAGNADRPFFCYVPYNTPHSPFQVPDKYFDKYKQQGLDDTLACVYGMCESLDDNLGRLLDHLDNLNIEDETIVIFLTDNGPNTNRFNGNMKGRKGSVHEGGVRVPCFIRWPEHIPAARVIDQLAGHIDILPTLAQLCDVTLPSQHTIDGVSLVPLLQADDSLWPKRKIFTHQFRGGKVRQSPGSVRTQQWRAANTGKGWELYDMLADPGQTINLAQDHPRLVVELSQAYVKWFEDVTRGKFENIPTTVGHPQRDEVTLPGHEAYLHTNRRNGISYMYKPGWANDWITHWASTEEWPWWDIIVETPGKYEVTLWIMCPESDIGSRLRVQAGTSHIDVVINRAHSPARVPSPDRVPRKEVYEMRWFPLRAGVMELAQGRMKLEVHALSVANKRVCDLKGITLRRAGNQSE